MEQTRILIVEDEHLIALSLSLMLTKRGFSVKTAGTVAEADLLMGNYRPDALLLDLWLPDGSGLELLKRTKSAPEDLPVIVMTANADADSAVKALKLGADDFLGKPFSMEVLLKAIEKSLAKNRLGEGADFLQQELRKKTEDDKLVGISQAMVELFKMIKVCSETDAKTVLLMGESGTGKELVARAIHTHSARADAPFIEINCAAIPENLMESELFGHEKGAYTDAARRRKGIFERAEGGTVFLDEIGDMPLSMQAKVLKVIETKRFRRLGSEEEIQADVRIIAATHQDLPAMVRNRSFRGDLFYRLNVMSICLPPLRERKEDIPVLVSYFIHRLNEEYGKKVDGASAEAVACLTGYDWPGNVRQLRNTIERSLMLERDTMISSRYLDLEMRQHAMQTRQPFSPELRSAASGGSHGDHQPGVSMVDFERRMIRQGLEITGWNQTKAAEYLSISRDTLRYRMKKFGLVAQTAMTE